MQPAGKIFQGASSDVTSVIPNCTPLSSYAYTVVFLGLFIDAFTDLVYTIQNFK